jgi:hypothetical protein
MAQFAVILVHSTSHAIQAERVLKRAKLKAKLIPTPRQLSSDCGSAVRIQADERVRAEQVLAETGVPIDRIEPLAI